MPYKDKNTQLLFQRDYQANKTLVRRFVVMQFLGGKCSVCGEDDIVCLQIDHIEPILRQKFDFRFGQKTVNDIYIDLENIDNLQILCANCHLKKTYLIDKFKFKSYLG